MFTLNLHQGRLLEGRIWSPVALPEVSAFARRFFELVGPLPGQVVICMDVRRTHVMPPEVAQSFVGVMKSDNPRVLRSGYLISDSATFALQLERMMRDGGNPARRAFRETADLAHWLGEQLDARERARLAEFLREPLP